MTTSTFDPDPWKTVLAGSSAAGNGVTVRDRDTGKQERLPIEKLKEFLREKIGS